MQYTVAEIFRTLKDHLNRSSVIQSCIEIEIIFFRKDINSRYIFTCYIMTKDLAVKTMGWNEMSSLVYQVLGFRSGLLYTSTGGGRPGVNTTQLTFAQKVPLFIIGFNLFSDLYMI